ncbi:MAG: type II secretion system minor pseudopilin GspH [Gammaproteobacteria bacterium]
MRTTPNEGFTLIELLVVIVIISIVASFAVLSINFNQNKRLESISHQLANTLTLAEQEALLRSTTLGFVLNSNSFQFFEFHTPKNPEDNPWQAITDGSLGLHHIPDDVQMNLKVNGKNVPSGKPTLVISPSGDITAFVIYIAKKHSTPRYKVVGERNGSIKSEMMNEE